jgi:hypothetical protein
VQSPLPITSVTLRTVFVCDVTIGGGHVTIGGGHMAKVPTAASGVALQM